MVHIIRLVIFHISWHLFFYPMCFFFFGRDAFLEFERLQYQESMTRSLMEAKMMADRKSLTSHGGKSRSGGNILSLRGDYNKSLGDVTVPNREIDTAGAGLF